MTHPLNNLEPQPLWNYFGEICQVPRPSEKEEKIIAYLLEFARNHQLEFRKDEAGNVLIRKAASAGCEQAPVVVLQSHIDMVCEKNSGKEHNFDTDPISPLIDGEWVKAEGTTLGADNGIGMAAQLALLSARELKHGPLECLFTVDEETGLSGAFALQPDFFSGRILLNLDSEDDGELFIGCAGGVDTVATFPLETEAVPAGHFAIRLGVKGLQGGHSGDDIHRGRGNANKILNRFLWQASRHFDMRLAWFNGGNLRNAIAREAEALVTVPHPLKEALVAEWNIFSEELRAEYRYTEPGLAFTHSSELLPGLVLAKALQSRVLNAIYACPHGVLEMSSRMPGMVETSTNLASVKFTGENTICITTSQRSELESRRLFAAEMVRSVFELAGAGVSHSEGYPGWTPNPDSEILRITAQSYRSLFGEEPVIRSIHAGLECGLFLKKYPGLDMVSFGPTIRGAHSPDERVRIESVSLFWKHLTDVLERVAETDRS